MVVVVAGSGGVFCECFVIRFRLIDRAGGILMMGP